jgi:SAM-dependent methyltransferase
MTFYDQIAKYYDYIQRGVTRYEKEAREIDHIFRPHQVDTILDLACGTGSHVIELAKLGYCCTGQDTSPEMLEMAKKKAEDGNLEIDFVKGDMCAYGLERQFDAVLGLYAFTSLVSDEAFRSGLTSAGKAVRPGGLFYLNLLNADFEGAEQMTAANAPPAFFMDVVVAQPELRLVRLNQTLFHGDIQDWTAIHLIDEGAGLHWIVDTRQLRFHHMNWVEQELTRSGFSLKSVTYADVQGLKCWDIFILAQAESV